jgi:DNA-binding NtrC family response regulator
MVSLGFIVGVSIGAEWRFSAPIVSDFVVFRRRIANLKSMHSRDSRRNPEGGSTRWARRIVVALTLAVVTYSVWVLWLSASLGDIGARCVFATSIKESVDPERFSWTSQEAGEPDYPKAGDLLLAIGPPVSDGPDGPPASDEIMPTRDYTEYIRAQKRLGDWLQQGYRKVQVRWESATSPGIRHSSIAELKERPWPSWLRSLVWFTVELVMLGIGARVYWKRPDDASACLFFWLCAFTMAAYVGGYHWSEIVVQAPLIYLFALFGTFVPVLSLHFYLLFPTPLAIYQRYRWMVLAVIYGIPGIGLLLLWYWMWRLGEIQGSGAPEVVAALTWVRMFALTQVGFALVFLALCLACLTWRARRSQSRRERDQIKWIWWASLISLVPIGLLIGETVLYLDTSSLSRESSAWLMFSASLLYTAGYAASITRYKLLQVDQILTRSAAYVAVSLAASLLYLLVLVVSTLVIEERLLTGQTSRQVILAGITALAILLLMEPLRGYFQRAIDRSFHREKYKFDAAMARMSQAVGSLLDRETMSRRFLEATGEVLRVEWATVWLRGREGEGEGEGFQLASALGPEPDERSLEPSNPLIVRFRGDADGPIALPRASDAPDPAADALIRLGGELAYDLRASDDRLVGLLVLGPKRSGLPFEDEELVFLNALVSVAGLSLHASEIQRTLEDLNRDLSLKVEKIAEQQRRILALEREMKENRRVQEEAAIEASPAGPAPSIDTAIRGSSIVVHRMLHLAARVAESSSAVLITGESGTGKELLAETIHRASPRADGPFVKVHCAALSRHLLESELFGHVRGSFTGADRDRVGRFQQANGGTLFLDEIGDISLEVQVKLLRVLQEKAFEMVGSSRTVSVDVRILAATHQDLESLIRLGKFREDLYYRLNVISIRTPALRERKGDIPELAAYFLARHAEKLGRPAPRLAESALEALSACEWPGNIRELENVIERAVVLSDGEVIAPESLPPEVIRGPHGSIRPRGYSVPQPAWGGEDGDGDGSHQRQRLIAAIRDARGNKSEAARLLGLPRSTFFSQLKKYGLA